MKKRKHKVNKIIMISSKSVKYGTYTKSQIEAFEREYYERYNSEITQWQQNIY
jgi:hypothetical protein